MLAFLVAARFADPIVSLQPYQFARDRKEPANNHAQNQCNPKSRFPAAKHARDYGLDNELFAVAGYEPNRQLDLVTRQEFPQYNDPGDPVAQLDRANGFEPLGSGFKSRRGRHLFALQGSSGTGRTWRPTKTLPQEPNDFNHCEHKPERAKKGEPEFLKLPLFALDNQLRG